MVKMRGVQVKAGIFDEKIHDLGVKCVCLFVFMLFCEEMKTILYGMGWELCLDPAQMEISLIRPPQL